MYQDCEKEDSSSYKWKKNLIEPVKSMYLSEMNNEPENLVSLNRYFRLRNYCIGRFS